MTDGQKFALFLAGVIAAFVFSLAAEGCVLYTLFIDDNATIDAQKAASAIFPSVLAGWFRLVAGWKLD